jgi:hypothetical protein
MSLLLFTGGCKKWLFDYRNKFAGDYSFNFTVHYWDGQQWTTTSHETDGKIFYKPLHNSGRTVTIQLSTGEKFSPHIDKQGNLKGDCPSEIEGSISDGKVFFTAVGGGMCEKNPGKGPSSTYTVTGTKK